MKPARQIQTGKRLETGQDVSAGIFKESSARCRKKCASHIQYRLQTASEVVETDVVAGC